MFLMSHPADQNQEMLYKIHFLPENISVAELSVFPSGNDTSGKTYTTEKQKIDMGC